MTYSNYHGRLLPLLYEEVMKPSPQQRETTTWAKQTPTRELPQTSGACHDEHARQQKGKGEHALSKTNASKQTRIHYTFTTTSKPPQIAHVKNQPELRAQAKNVRRSTHSYSPTHATQTWR
ncbi:unnamed protein product [Ectocarpus sp. 13 AM-2016]